MPCAPPPEATLVRGRPIRWSSTAMSDGEYFNSPFCLAIQNREGKSPHTYPSNIWHSFDSVTMGILADLLQHAFELGQVPCPKASTSFFIVGDVLKMLCLRLGMELIRHRSRARAFRRTSSAGIGSTSPRSSSRARRLASSSQATPSSPSDSSSRLSSRF